MDRFAPLAPPESTDPCQDADSHPRRCIADFVNAAFGRTVQASSTCGSPPTTHCLPPGFHPGPASGPEGELSKKSKSCSVCDASSARLRHPAAHLTDLNNPNNVTCWMSEPGAQNVTLTLHLGKKFEVGCWCIDEIVIK